MSSNPFLKKLGLAATDRVVIFHADDIGMCEASVSAYRELLDFGLMSSAATMVPCSWFPATAAFCRTNPQVDMGIHLTLNSEWDGYRWRPVSTSDPTTGLLDREGYLHRREVDLHQQAERTAVYTELKAQIDYALTNGITPTHVDTHMLAIFPTYLDMYLQLAQAYKLPAFVFRCTIDQLKASGIAEATARQWLNQIMSLEEQGLPLLDHWCVMSYTEHENRFEQAKAHLENLPAGFTYFLFHPATDTPELRAIAADWRTRVADYELFKDEKFRQYVKQLGIHIIGWRELKALMI
jgi:predicted glycoside hydrolase/deacetylase ChbG (UPF0249 family)